VIPAEFWRNADQFLANGGGWVAERDAVFGAMAFSSFRSGSQIELGIETAPDARRLGLATAVARRMISDALAQGLTPVWSCRAGNVGSYRLARKLGFVPVREVPYYRLGVR
jgi:RimJ/RimL family protein N-acetyltransferase